ncbi:glycosyltransferase [Sphaerochaeta halotolerans]|nr:glycosyltransferase [Sphaerochaeta halotolerans]
MKTDNEYTTMMRACINEKEFLLSPNNSLIDLIRCDIVHINWFENLSSNRIKKLLVFLCKIVFFIFVKTSKKTLIYTFHNKKPHDNNSRLSLALMKMQERLSDQIIIHSIYSKQFLEKRNQWKAFYVPHPNYVNAYHDNIQYQNIKDNDKQLVFLCFGAVRPYKNLEVVIDSANYLKDRNIKFLICGSCKSKKYRSDLYNRVESGNVKFDFRFISNDEIPSLIGVCDAMILPYDTTSSLNSGAAILSFSFAKTVLSSNIGTVEDLKNTGNVYLYNYSSDPRVHADRLVEQIEKLINDYNKDPNILLNKGKRLQGVVIKYNSTETVSKLLTEVYSQ